MWEWFQQGITGLSELPGYLLDANKRIYGLYLLGALLLAIPAFYLKYGQFRWRDFGRYLFNPKIWWHQSAKLDYGLFLLNKPLKALMFAPFIVTMVPIAMGLSGALESLFGVIPPLSQNEAVVIASFTLLLFLLDDFTRFLLHYLLHKVPFLWDYHKVHHSARVLTPMTIYRSHPLESYLYACRMGLAQGVAVGLGYYLFGPALSMFDVLGANVFVFAFNALGSNLRHSHVWLPFGDRIEKWWISPAQHQVHHSDNPAHFDRNLGSALAVWDRLFGTLIKSSEVKRVRFGVGRGDPGHQTMKQLYLKPFTDNWQRIKPRLSKKAPVATSQMD
ncbi:Alkylglycerol monooxygenase [Saliniradius amylolyticus]|uniref:Alkylglycerol monooxygenase n=1 Tax=Saliniradius amylolyticus TaxID=2183582 RepID=A0A2S2E3W6_9ALTE|nr:sterol desaturase family protein [Saliniradius amylolyticus]AWL12335.1 Alkylglycerol monooxygenase [Saliniradius amylolyticus]